MKWGEKEVMEENWRLEWVRMKNGEVGGEFEGRWV